MKPWQPPIIKPFSPKQALYDALLGKGLYPFSLWVFVIGIPVLVITYLKPTNNYLVWIIAMAIAQWTIPLESISKAASDLGKLRECLHECAPFAPGLVPYLPQLLPVLILNIHKVGPYSGDLAPFLKYLLPYPDFVTKALPILLRKIDLMAPLIPEIGPQFAQMDRRHFSKIEIILPDLVDQIEELLPMFHIIQPHLVEISLRADRLFPVVHYLIPHAEKMGKHIGWLVPFADIENFEEFLPFIDRLAPYIDDFAPYGPQLLPYISKIRKHMPILLENIDGLAPNLGAVVNQMDPLVYWLSDLLPLANNLGLLRYKLVVQAGTPFARFLPAVPTTSLQSTQQQQQQQQQQQLSITNGNIVNNGNNTIIGPSEKEDIELFRLTTTSRSIKLPRVNRFNGVDYYVLTVNDKYAGEFRYSHLREMNTLAEKMMTVDCKCKPPFPGKHAGRPHTAAFLEDRRVELERFVAWVFSEPDICSTRPFVAFIRLRRRWGEELPMLTSPLIAS
jgi:hypothetical protein